MSIRIALAGNPNCGKTTLFNTLTGSNQYVGNWPGVTVEKKEGQLKGSKDVIITDLPGIYSLSPYTPEEIVARNYLVGEQPEAILNIIDGTNLERNLYLTTQFLELGIPVVAAINMMDVVRKNGDKIDTAQLSKKLGCPVVEISALKNTGIDEAVAAAISAAETHATVPPKHNFSGVVEHAIAHIEEAVLHDLPEEQQRWYAIKIFERDANVMSLLNLSENKRSHIENDIKAAELELDDDAESIITNDRYNYISEVVKGVLERKNNGGMTVSDKIDAVVSNRFLGLPIFALIMFLVYYISMVTVGNAAGEWTNNGLFGKGWYLFGIGRSEYTAAYDDFSAADTAVKAFGFEINPDKQGFNEYSEITDMLEFTPTSETAAITTADPETLIESETLVYYDRIPKNAPENTNAMSFKDAVDYYKINGFNEPQPQNYGVWVTGIPVLIENSLDYLHCEQWLKRLILDGIVAGVGGVLGFVPQLFVLFAMLAFLESCGYMSRVAFVLDRIFRKFGLSGKSFIPILIGTGCGVPGIMSSRTIENESDRRMTVITTTFIPCGAKVPFISLIAGAVFGGSPLVSTGAYLIGIAAIITSGIMLKKTKPFESRPAPFVMELPPYHLPTAKSVLSSMWERGWSFIKKAVSLILISSVAVWFLSSFGVVEGSFKMLSEQQAEHSILAVIGNAICWIFIPLGFGNWQSAVASLTGIIAKENIVGTLGVLYGGAAGVAEAFTQVSALSFMVFNLLCAPCVAAISAIRREMNSLKWFWFAIGYQCGFAYAVSLMVNNFGRLLTGAVSGIPDIIGVVAALAVLGVMLFMLLRPAKKLQNT